MPANEAADSRVRDAELSGDLLDGIAAAVRL